MFIGTHPWITFFLAYIAASLIKTIFAYCINRPLQHMNIRKHGWPPEHCDADGDFTSKENN